jgi:hypothetical protein
MPIRPIADAAATKPARRHEIQARVALTGGAGFFRPRAGLRRHGESFGSRVMASNIFTRHPRELGESYAVHFVNASSFGLRMLAGGAAILVHAVLPFLFVHTGSRTMAKLHQRITGRAERVEWERYPII